MRSMNSGSRIAHRTPGAMVMVVALSIATAGSANAAFLGWKAQTSFSFKPPFSEPLAVMDVYATYSTSAQLLTVSGANIQVLGGTLVIHSDNSPFGSWSPSAFWPWGDPNDPNVDSFVTIGGSGGPSNTTSLVPGTWDGATDQVIPFGAAWTDSAPGLGQGNSSLVTFGDGATHHAVLVGRFVTIAAACCFAPCPDPFFLSFGASHESIIGGSVATGSDAQMFQFEYWCLPSPAGIVLFAMGGLPGGARRRRTPRGRTGVV